MSTPRITPAEAVQAYRVTGMRPVKCVYFKKKGNCGCPLSALYVAENPTRLFGAPQVREWANKKYGTNYSIGFRRGVDDGSQDGWGPCPMGFGVADGSAAWQAVLAAVADGTITGAKA